MTQRPPSLPPLSDVFADIEAAPSLVTRVTYKIFVVVATVLSLVMMAIFYLAPLPGHAREVLYFINFTASIFLLFDVGLRLFHAQSKRRYFLPLGLCDLIGSLPGIPFLRLFRVPTLLVLLRDLRHTTWHELLETARDWLAESTLLSGIIIAFLVVTLGGTAIVAVEAPAPGSNIKNAGDALWYAIVTISTVGYGDKHPITVPGRLIGSAMIVVGVGIFTVLTGYISTQFLVKRRRIGSSDVDLLRHRMEALFEEQRRLAADDRAALEAQLADLRRQLEQRE